jgi:Glyoxalase-like domain
MLPVHAQPLAHGGNLHGGEVADGELVVAGRHGPMLLETADPAFDRVPLLVIAGVEGGWTPTEAASPLAPGDLVTPLRDSTGDAASTQVEAVGPGTVRLVVRFQLVIDCADPDRLARFWAAALDYELEPVPKGFDSWDDYYRDLGLGEEFLGHGEDSIADPHGQGPRIWFQQVPDVKTVKNRLHLDIAAGGDRSVPLETRKARIDAEAQRLVGLGATLSQALAEPEPGIDHYAVAMTDPEGNEFDIN